jgi:hypothetical protein
MLSTFLLFLLVATVPSKQALDPCSLLTSADVQAVQGEPVKHTQPGLVPSGGMMLSQCLFQTETASKSVTVAIAMPNSSNAMAVSPRDFWRRQFHSSGREKSAGKDAHEREEENQARPISGLGQEAYWIGNPMVGALYVLHGNKFLRISIGGVRDESARIEKSKALARAALKRM